MPAAPSPARRAFARLWPRALAVALPATLLFHYARRFHEPWRDEIQALLIGRDVPLSGLWHAMRLEGSPPLYHLLLRLLCHLFLAPTALTVAASIGYATLLAGTLHLLIVVSRRPGAAVGLTLLLACTNTYAYELGVVSRPYGIGVGLCLAGLAELLVAHRLRRPRRALVGSVLLGLAAVTSDHAACVAGAALASFAITETTRHRSVRPALPTLASLPFFAVTWALMAPYAERTPEVARAANPTLAGAASQAALFLESGGLAGGWWHRGGPEPPPSWPAFRLFAAALALIALTRLWTRRRDRAAFALVSGAVLLSWATLLYIFVAWYSGGYRHHLFLWMPALIVALGWLLDARPAPGRAPGRARWLLGLAALLLLPWFGYQLHMAWDDLRADHEREFTQTKAAAFALPPGAHVVSDHDFSIVGLRLWRSDLTLRSADSRGRGFRHLVVDRDWHARVPLDPIVVEECREAPDRTFFAHHSAPLGRVGGCLRLVQKRHGLLPTERFDLHRVDCRCAARF